MRRVISSRLSLTVAFVASLAGTAVAQSSPSERFMDNCRRNRSDYEQFCEARNFTVAAARSLSWTDARTAESPCTPGTRPRFRSLEWCRPTPKARAKRRASRGRSSFPRAMATSARMVRATGRRNESWSVSFEIWAPRQTELALTASNGGISVDGMNSRMSLETVNGGLTVTDVDGDVRGSTVNGGITAELSGDRWHGSGLDLRTSNGGVHLYVPPTTRRSSRPARPTADWTLASR